jgi:zinc and cadmium transporter
LTALVGFASGSLIGGAFIHLLPESLEETGQTVFYYVIVGIVFFFIMEKFLYWRHCHEEKCPVHTFAYLNLIGDGIHNFIDGMLIAASFILSYDLGVATTLAVIFHEIPQEIGDFGILIYGGFTKGKALAYNFVSALTAVAGALITYYLAYVQGIEQFLVPFAAGGFIYIAATDLMPELHKKSHATESIIQLFSILAGIGLMSAMKILLS